MALGASDSYKAAKAGFDSLMSHMTTGQLLDKRNWKEVHKAYRIISEDSDKLVLAEGYTAEPGAACAILVAMSEHVVLVNFLPVKIVEVAIDGRSKLYLWSLEAQQDLKATSGLDHFFLQEFKEDDLKPK